MKTAMLTLCVAFVLLAVSCIKKNECPPTEENVTTTHGRDLMIVLTGHVSGPRQTVIYEVRTGYIVKSNMLFVYNDLGGIVTKIILPLSLKGKYDVFAPGQTRSYKLVTTIQSGESLESQTLTLSSK